VSVVSISVSRPLSVEKSMVSIAVVGIRSISLGRGIKSLGDWVQTSGRSEGNSESVSMSVEGVSVSGPLSVDKSMVSVSVVSVGSISLGGSIKSLGDGV